MKPKHERPIKARVSATRSNNRRLDPRSLPRRQVILEVIDRLEAIRSPNEAVALAVEWGGNITLEIFQAAFNIGSTTLRSTNKDKFKELASQIKRVRKLQRRGNANAGSATVKQPVAETEVDHRPLEEIVEDLRAQLKNALKKLNSKSKSEPISKTIASLRAKVQTLQAILTAQVEENLSLHQRIEDFVREARSKN